MPLLATLNNPRAAQGFIDYMAIQSVIVEVRPLGPQQVELWVEEQHFALAQREFEQFSQNPNDSKYQNASWQRNSDDNPLSYDNGGNSLVKSWFGRGGLVTHSVVALCILIFASFHLPVGNNVYYALLFADGNPLDSVELWRWFTPALIHFSVMHIAFNLLWWWMLGGQLEQHFGKVFLLAFMVMTAVVSNYAQFIVSGSNQFGGLSGVVYALIGFSWLYGKLKASQPISLNNQLFGFAMIWLVLGYADILSVNFANTAHLSGLLAGLGFAFVTAKR
ncbi:MAG: GlpG protein [Phenylobacterium sp.]|jgi:GlpG protein